MTDTYDFTLLRDEQVPELKTRARLYRHDATGAEVLSLENADENKVFGIAFRTLPSDSTGIAHILEHAVLCGSERYPLKKPFVELLKGSLNTFLNAMTYPDKTIYPVASTNLQDFYNLSDVYLDAVLHPRITPEILQQEGWHYEIEDGRLVYKGVVFNEMKGANASPERVLYSATQRNLLPDTIYAVDSGGDPTAIPDLTYAQFKAFHETYYHPSNARIVIYGDDDPQERLRRLSAGLAGYTHRAVDSTIALQPPFAEPRRTTQRYAAGQDGAKSMLNVSWLIPGAADQELALALGVLEHALLGTNAAPLRKALIDSGLGENLTGSGFGDQRQSYFTVGLKGIAAESATAVETLITDTIADLAARGIDRDTVAASLNTIEFRLREYNTGSSPRGLSLWLRSLDSWLYDGDPIAPLLFERPLAALKQNLASDPRYFETLLERLILGNPHRSTVLLLPDAALGEQQSVAERARLDAAQAAMTPAQLDDVAQTAARLRQLQDTPDTPEALASLPSLTRLDLNPAISTIPTVEEQHGGARLLFHDLFTNGIAYLELSFDLTVLDAPLLPYVGLFCRSLTETGTDRRDMIQLSQWIGRTTGGVGAGWSVMSRRNTPDPLALLTVRGKATVAQTGELLTIVDEVLRGARLDNRERIRQMVLEDKASREAGLVPGGHSAVNARLRARFSVADWATEQMGSISYLLFLRDLVRRIDEDWPSVQAALEQIRALVIDRGALVANVTVDADGWAQIRPQLASFIDRLPARQAQRQTWQVGAARGDEGLIIPAQVNYVGKGANLYELGYTLHGSALVINRYLRTTWLWEQIREQGGAYGGFSIFDTRTGVMSLVSYRDPNLTRTLDVYDGTANFLRTLDLSERELTRAIIGAVGDLDGYQLPDAKGSTAMIRLLLGDDDAYRQRIRDEVLGTTLADFHAFGDVLAQLAARGAVVAMGGEAAMTTLAASRPDVTLTRVL